MATYFLRVRKLGRKTGSRVTRAAAYRAGERIHDERSSDVFDFCTRQDVMHKEIVLAQEFAHRADMEWARNREALWNSGEHINTRRDAMLAREVLVLLPPELSHEQRTKLVRRFSQELADKYRIAVDFAVHTPKPGADPRHHHAHILMTNRELTPSGLGRRSALELGGTERRLQGLGPSKEDYLRMRERWAELSNEALKSAGREERIDNRSYAKRGLNREPKPAMPQKIYYAERKDGITTRVGDAIRVRHRERVEARVKGKDELAGVLDRQRSEDRQRVMNAAKQRDGPEKRSRTSMTREELNQLRRERHRVNAESLNQKRRERYKQNAEKQRRRFYREHAAEFAAKRWAKMRSEELARATPAPPPQELERKGPPPNTFSPTTEEAEAARNWLLYRAMQSPSAASEEAEVSFSSSLASPSPLQPGTGAVRWPQAEDRTQRPIDEARWFRSEVPTRGQGASKPTWSWR